MVGISGGQERQHQKRLDVPEGAISPNNPDRRQSRGQYSTGGTDVIAEGEKPRPPHAVDEIDAGTLLIRSIYIAPTSSTRLRNERPI